jgi:hypothetical protein
MHARAHTHMQELIWLMAVGELTNEFVCSLYSVCIVPVYSVQLNLIRFKLYLRITILEPFCECPTYCGMFTQGKNCEACGESSC